jgi:hypothetical protein
MRLVGIMQRFCRRVSFVVAGTRFANVLAFLAFAYSSFPERRLLQTGGNGAVEPTPAMQARQPAVVFPKSSPRPSAHRLGGWSEALGGNSAPGGHVFLALRGPIPAPWAFGERAGPTRRMRS